jgi:mRNA-degrading endonuclease HigB of HigAB toxin-antitoxin module
MEKVLKELREGILRELERLKGKMPIVVEKTFERYYYVIDLIGNEYRVIFVYYPNVEEMSLKEYFETLERRGELHNERDYYLKKVLERLKKL